MCVIAAERNRNKGSLYRLCVMAVERNKYKGSQDRVCVMAAESYQHTISTVKSSSLTRMLTQNLGYK